VPTRGEHLNGARLEVDDDAEEIIRYSAPLSPEELCCARAKLASDIVVLMVRDLEPDAAAPVVRALATAQSVLADLRDVLEGRP
jgi:hypothetical protein